MISPKVEDLSPIERAIFNLVGEKGVELFRIADGKITVEEAAKILKISEEEIENIIKKLEGRFIRIEYEEEKEEKIKGKEKEEIVPIDLPKKIFQPNFMMKTELTLEFGPQAAKILELIDGERDIIQISVEANVKLDYTDEIMWWLAERKILRFSTLTQHQIKKRYGSIGLKIYEKYGREGIFLYMLLDKYADPKLAIKASGLELTKAVDIYELIHRLISPPFLLDKKELLSLLNI